RHGPDEPYPRPPRGDRAARLGRSGLRRQGRPRPPAAVPPRHAARVHTPGDGRATRRRVATAARPPDCPRRSPVPLERRAADGGYYSSLSNPGKIEREARSLLGKPPRRP